MMNKQNSPLRGRQGASDTRLDIYSKAKPYAVSRSDSTRIFLPDGKCFGIVIGDTLYKKVKGKKHILQKPQAITCDIAALELARQLGARKFEVTDTWSGKVYKTQVSTFDSLGFDAPDYGYGEQRGLRLQYWQQGNEPFIEQLRLWQ